MLFVGDYVKLIGCNSHMGVVTKINGNIVSVFVKHPQQYTMDTYDHLVELVSTTEYERYLNNKPTGNYVIDHAKDNGKSIEQQLMDMYYEGDVSAWMQPIFWEESEKFWNLTEEDFKPVVDDETNLSVKEQEDLKKMYIELALLTNDEEWFNELTSEK